MQISAEGKIGIALGLVALAGAGALVVAPAPWVTVIGWAMIVVAVLGGFMLAYHHFRNSRQIIIVFLFAGFCLLILGAPIFAIVKILTPSGPQLEANINQILIAWEGDDPTTPALALIFVTVSNSGAPSIAKDFSISAELSGHTYPGKIYPMPRQIDARESHERYLQKDDLRTKTMTPIATGDFTQGILVANISNLEETMLRLSTYTLTFRDISGKKYETTIKPFADRRKPLTFPKIDIQKIP